MRESKKNRGSGSTKKLLFITAFITTCVNVVILLSLHAFGFISSDSINIFMDKEPECTLAFQKYISSPWEAMWVLNAALWDKEEEMCDNIPSDFVHLFLGGSRRAQSTGCGHSLKELGNDINKQVFSRYIWKDTCTSEQIETYIEPLVGLMRSPIYPCHAYGNDGLLDRDYIVYGRASQNCKMTKYPQLGANSRYKNFYFFDLGASVYQKGAGGASQQEFVDSYASLGVPLKNMHYFAWEIEVIEPQEVWRQVPGSLKPKYHWINIPASPARGSSDNPWTYLKSLCTKGDYVVVKLDIDDTPVETAFMEQLIADTELQGLIDEMFFEHHVNVEAMWQFWHTEAETVYLKDSYNWFIQLRTAGIRFHGWP